MLRSGSDRRQEEGDAGLLGGGVHRVETISCGALVRPTQREHL